MMAKAEKKTARKRSKPLGRDAVRDLVSSHLASIGFTAGSFRWEAQTASLYLVVAGQIRSLKLNGGMSRRALQFQLGRVTGWAEMLGLVEAPG